MKILIASSVSKHAIEKLKEDHDIILAFNFPEDELVEKVKDRNLIIFRSGVKISAKVMEAAPDLKFLIRAGSGLDNLDTEYASNRKLELVRIPQPGAKAVAELSFAFMLMLARDLLRADSSLRKGNWIKTQITGYLLTGKTLGVVGAGNIGSRVGEMGSAWGMNVLGCVDEPDNTPEYKSFLESKGIKLTSFDEVAGNADFLSIHVPLSDSTRDLIADKELAMMKKEACLINLARGGVVNEDALYKALTENRLRGAALDVHLKEGEGKISPLAELPNVVLTPHIGAQTIDSQREIGDRILKTVDEFEKRTITKDEILAE